VQIIDTVEARFYPPPPQPARNIRADWGHEVTFRWEGECLPRCSASSPVCKFIKTQNASRLWGLHTYVDCIHIPFPPPPQEIHKYFQC
jgi:hypothetical protein